MAFLTRDQIKGLVKQALKEVADFTGDIEAYEFKHFYEYHKKVFITKLKEFINKCPYYDRNGNSEYERYYDAPLSMQIVNTWKTIKDCIDYVLEYQIVKKRNPNKIQLS